MSATPRTDALRLEARDIFNVEGPEQAFDLLLDALVEMEGELVQYKAAGRPQGTMADEQGDPRIGDFGHETNSSPTPRTDEFANALYDSSRAAYEGSADRSPEDAYKLAIDFARTLERELTLCHQSGNNMNQAPWPALREYIGAEIALSHARRDFSEAETDEDRRTHAERVGKLQEQSTRMETAFRESLP